jgi:hypothetical protein
MKLRGSLRIFVNIVFIAQHSWKLRWPQTPCCPNISYKSQTRGGEAPHSGAFDKHDTNPDNETAEAALLCFKVVPSCDRVWIPAFFQKSFSCRKFLDLYHVSKCDPSRWFSMQSKGKKSHK